MTWFDLGTAKHRRPMGTQLRIAIEKRGVRISLPESIERDLGWATGDPVTLKRGHDEHYGYGLLTRVDDPNSGWLLHPLSGSSKGARGLRIVIGRTILGEPTLPLLPQRLSSTAADYRIVEGAVQFRVPWITVAQGSGDRPPVDAAPTARVTPAGTPHESRKAGDSGSPQHVAPAVRVSSLGRPDDADLARSSPLSAAADTARDRKGEGSGPPDPKRQAEEAAIARHIVERGVKVVDSPEGVAQFLRDAGHSIVIRESSDGIGSRSRPRTKTRVPVIDGKPATLPKLYQMANALRAKSGLPALSVPT